MDDEDRILIGPHETVARAYAEANGLREWHPPASLDGLVAALVEDDDFHLIAGTGPYANVGVRGIIEQGASPSLETVSRQVSRAQSRKRS